jgi:MFS family permease
VSDLRIVFALAAIPGVLAVLLIAMKVRESAAVEAAAALPAGGAFLLLRAGDLGVSAAHIPLLWAFFHVVKMASVYPFGALSDQLGRRGMILAGWFVYALAYLGFARAQSEWQIWALFAFYGLFYGLTEGTEKALLADFADPAERGAAFGWYNFAIGIGALPASLLFGAIWQQFGPQAAFGFGAGLAALAALLLWGLVRERGDGGHRPPNWPATTPPA